MSRIFGTVVAVIVAIVVAFAALGSWYTVDEGERAVTLRYGKVVGTAPAGLHWKTPFIDSIKRVSVQSHSLKYSNVAAYSWDQQPATMNVSVTYRIPESEVTTLYSMYGSRRGIQERLVERKVLGEVKNVFGKYTANRTVQELDIMAQDILESLRKSVEGQPIIIEGVQIEGVAFSRAYEESIELRMKAGVEVASRQQNLETERINAEIAVTQAQGRADSVKAEAEAKAYATLVQGEAEAEAIRARGEALKENRQLVDLIAAEKWNGELPTTMVPNAALPFVSVR